MPLYASSIDIETGVMDMGNTSFTTRIVHGQNSSLMLAERPPGYHSRPHTHDCEQLNVLHEGELHIYTEEAAYHLRAGDALRIPPNLIHWSWNRSDAPCLLIEVHTPGIHHDPNLSEFATALLDERDAVIDAGPINKFVDFPEAELRRIESLPPSVSASGASR